MLSLVYLSFCENDESDFTFNLCWVSNHLREYWSQPVYIHTNDWETIVFNLGRKIPQPGYENLCLAILKYNQYQEQEQIWRNLNHYDKTSRFIHYLPPLIGLGLPSENLAVKRVDSIESCKICTCTVFPMLL